MTEREIYMSLLGISVNTYYLWKRQGRPIMKLLESAFTKEELETFVTSGKIPRAATAQDLILSEVQNNSKMLSELLKYHMKIYKATIFKGLNKKDIQFILDNKELIFNLVEIKEILETNRSDKEIITILKEIEKILNPGEITK